MKKRWILSLLAATGGGVYLISKLAKKEKNEIDSTRKTMVEHYEKQGYNVHVYNENNDFMLFHPEKNEKRHVFYDDGLVDYEHFRAKLHAYYLHFTNEFFFVVKNEEVLEKTQALYQAWYTAINEETFERCGKPIAYFLTVEQLLQQ